MAIKPCRECGASISTEAQPCPKCGVPDPTKDKSAAADPIKDKSAAPEPIKGTAALGAPTEHKKSRWLIAGGSVFILAGVAIFFASAQPTPPAQPIQLTPPVASAPPETAESLAARY